MVPAQVPIVDHENPCYCPKPFQPRPDPTSPRRSSTTIAYSHKGVKKTSFGASTDRFNAFDYRRKEPVTGHLDQLASMPFNSSPCDRLPSVLDRKGPARRRAMYAISAREPLPFGFPFRERKEACRIKQEYSTPDLSASSDQDGQIHQVLKEWYERSPAFAPECGMEHAVSTRTLLLRLDEVFPGIGFREAAESVEHGWPETNAEYRSKRHQALVDLLAERGALNEYALTILYDAEFHHLDLGPTLCGVNELDLPRGDVMRGTDLTLLLSRGINSTSVAVFSQPGWFKRLTSLSFAGGRFQDDFSLVHLQSLGQIEYLVLANTGIGNEGIFHIVALKHKLQQLDLSGNPLIDDDSIPALILLENLQYLSMFGTAVSMPGLRKLAIAVRKGERVIVVDIPMTCKSYIGGMQKEYLLHLAPPLVSDPGAVSMLSKAALSRNLEAHATINPSIISTGPHEEMEERLKKILETRYHDLAVQDMLAGRGGAR